MRKKLLLIFLVALLLNLAWEFAHSVLYVSYKGEEITNLVLLYVSVMDGIYILALTVLAVIFKGNKTVFVILGGIIWAVILELWGTGTGRWVYGAAMPIIPVLQTGLTPTIQLALTGYLAEKLVFK